MIPGATDKEIFFLKEVILKNLPGAVIKAFGSRAAGTHKKTSDLDIAVDAGRKITLKEMAAINLEIEESDIPYRVDVVDLKAVEKGFADIIKMTEKSINDHE